MLVLCAWCRRDGEPGYLGEREPLDNPETTHSICAAHKNQLLESLPSRSFPYAKLLIVVDRENIELYAQLERVFLGLPGVKVLLDRRGSDRRSGPPLEWRGGRRQNTRRIRKGGISPLGGFTIVRFTPKAKPGAIRGQREPASTISASESAHREP